MTTILNAHARRIALALVAAAAIAVPATTQPLDTYRWQLAPYCNIISMNVTQTTATPTVPSAVYLLDGFDDQCGGSRSSAIGSAFFNADGSIGIGLTTVLVPGGQAVHGEARISRQSLSGTWRDDAGHSGTFVYLPGTTSGTGGALRPPPAPVLGPNAVGAAHINPGEVQVRIAGSCPSGQYLRGIGADGSVTCETLPPTASAGATCAAGQYVRGLGAGGSLVCESLPPIASVGGSCPDGQVLNGIAPDGSVMCRRLLAVNVSTTVDDLAAIVGEHSSIAIGADGFPVISHRTAAGALRVTKCRNAACTVKSSRTVDNPGMAVGAYTSIAVPADGRPVISHFNMTTAALRVSKCIDADCSGATSVDVDDPTNAVGAFSSMAIGADGLPIISYHDQSAGTLRVTKCGNADCTSGNITNTVDDPVEIVGLHTSIDIGTDGRPVISHYLHTSGALRVTKCGDAACASGNVSTTVDAPGYPVGRFTSLAIGTDGFPVISYEDAGSSSGLRVTKCGNPACTADNVSTTVDAAAALASFGGYTSIAIGVNGLPIISHADFTSGSLRVTSCTNAACTSASTVVADKPEGVVGAFSAIAIPPDGLPVISHFNTDSSTLRVTKCATTTCQ